MLSRSIAEKRVVRIVTDDVQAGRYGGVGKAVRYNNSRLGTEDACDHVADTVSGTAMDDGAVVGYAFGEQIHDVVADG